MEENAASSRVAVMPLLTCCFELVSCFVCTGATGKLPFEFDESVGPLCCSERLCCGGDIATELGFFINSAAKRTLVGTRLSLMAPLPDEGVVAEVSLAAGLNADEESELVVHGDGSGLRGEIIDAEDDRLGMALVLRPPTSGIFRMSRDVGLRNSDGLLCLGGLRKA